MSIVRSLSWLYYGFAVPGTTISVGTPPLIVLPGTISVPLGVLSRLGGAAPALVSMGYPALFQALQPPNKTFSVS